MSKMSPVFSHPLPAVPASSVAVSDLWAEAKQIKIAFEPDRASAITPNSFATTGIHATGVGISARLTQLRARLKQPLDAVERALAQEVFDIMQHRVLFGIEAEENTVFLYFALPSDLEVSFVLCFDRRLSDDMFFEPY